MKPIAEIREANPTYDMCVKKIEECDATIKTMEAKDKDDPRIESYRELKAEVERLVKFFDRSKDKIGEFETRYQDVLAELQALTPLTRETKAERQASLRKVTDLTGKLAKTSEVLAIFGDTSGDKYFKNIRGETGQSVRDLVSDFYGKGAGAKESKERELQIAPTESEKKLAVYYSGKTPAELAVFFDSKEYKELKTEFNKMTPREETAREFLKTEFAKMASLETPEERKKLLTAMRNFSFNLSSRNGPLDDTIVQVLQDGGKHKHQVHDSKWFTDILKGKSEHNHYNLSMEAYDMQARYRMAVAIGGGGDSPDLEYAMPSYVIWKLYRENKLSEFGIDDKKFFEIVGMNQYNGVYFNFANLEKMEDQNRYVWYNQIKDKSRLIAMVKEESKNVAKDLVPTVNVGTSQIDAANNIRYGNGRERLIKGGEYGLRRDSMHGAVESTQEGSDPINEEGRIVYEENYGKKETEVKKSLAAEENSKKSDELTRQLEGLEYGGEIDLDRLLAGEKMDLSSSAAMVLDTVRYGLAALDKKAEGLKELINQIGKLLENDALFDKTLTEYEKRIAEIKKEFHWTKSKLNERIAEITRAMEETKTGKQEMTLALKQAGRAYRAKLEYPAKAGIDADKMELNEETLKEARALYEITVDECKRLIALFDEHFQKYQEMVGGIGGQENIQKLDKLKKHTARVSGINPKIREKYGKEK